MATKCPRCGNSVKVQTKNYTVSGQQLEVNKNECPACSTRFYFEEDVISLFYSMRK